MNRVRTEATDMIGRGGREIGDTWEGIRGERGGRSRKLVLKNRPIKCILGTYKIIQKCHLHVLYMITVTTQYMHSCDKTTATQAFHYCNSAKY